MSPEQAEKIINATEPGWRVVSVTVPTRALRVIRDDLGLIFRVEQLDSRTWTWFVCSTHAGDVAFESFGPACQDSINKQARLKEKIKLAQHEARMAEIKARSPLVGDGPGAVR